MNATEQATVQIPVEFLEDPEINSSTLRMWAILAMRADEDDRITITLDQIAEVATFMSQRQALVQVKAMETIGIVDVERGVSRRFPNTYIVRRTRRHSAPSSGKR